MQELLVIIASGAAVLFIALRIRSYFRQKQVCNCELCPERDCASRTQESRNRRD